jgi:hypothetical protein
MSGNMIPILIVAIVMFALVMRARYRYLGKNGDGARVDDRAETIQLREEVKALKERIHVLERIAVDKEDTLSRQIEELRDR